MSNDAYVFSFKNIHDSGELKLSDYRDKVVLVVNTASQCGYTKQYDALEALYKKYHAQGLEVIAVPSNDFGGQEPGTNQEIKNFCETKFNISFPIAERVKVKGKESHPFFNWVREEKGILAGPKWNFYKYLIGRDGKLIDWFSSMTAPLSDKLISAIEENL